MQIGMDICILVGPEFICVPFWFINQAQMERVMRFEDANELSNRGCPVLRAGDAIDLFGVCLCFSAVRRWYQNFFCALESQKWSYN